MKAVNQIYKTWLATFFNIVTLVCILSAPWCVPTTFPRVSKRCDKQQLCNTSFKMRRAYIRWSSHSNQTVFQLIEYSTYKTFCHSWFNVADEQSTSNQQQCRLLWYHCVPIMWHITSYWHLEWLENPNTLMQHIKGPCPGLKSSKNRFDNHVKNKRYGNFVSISSLTGKCAAQKLKFFCSSSLWTCLHYMVILRSQNKITDFFMILACVWAFNPSGFDCRLLCVHRTLCSLFHSDTDGTSVSKCRQFSLQRRGLDPLLFQCWSSVVGGGPILKQHVKTSCLLGSTQVFVYTQPSPSIIFSPADHSTFSKTAGQSQAYYNTWNWEWGTYDVIHLQILTCEVAVSTAGSVIVWCKLLIDVSHLTSHLQVLGAF